MGLTEQQLEAVRFANGQLTYLEGGPEPPEPGPKRRGYRFARSISEHLSVEGSPTASPSSDAIVGRTDDDMPDDAELEAMESYEGPQEHHADRADERDATDR